MFIIPPLVFRFKYSFPCRLQEAIFTRYFSVRAMGPKSGGMKYYAVRVGRRTGIFHSWDECRRQTEGFSKSVFKSFPTLEEAQRYLNGPPPPGPSNASTITGRTFVQLPSFDSFINSTLYTQRASVFTEIAPPSTAPLSRKRPLELVDLSDESHSEDEAVMAPPIEDDDEPEVDIFTDGSCLGNPGPGGWGCVVTYRLQEGFKRIEMAGCDKQTTNNRMELQAVIEALDSIPEKNSSVRLHLDSSYVKNGITSWISAWKRNGWKRPGGEEVKNQDLWMELDRATNRHTIEWVWVKGHAGHPGNELADSLATRAATTQTPLFSERTTRTNELRR